MTGKAEIGMTCLPAKEHKELLSARGTWVVQLVECPTLDFGSGHDLRVMRLSSTLGSMLSGESA